MPQVQFDKTDEEPVAICISNGWYFAPNVTWLDRGERDLSNQSTVEILEEQINGLFRVYSVLKYPVKLNEKYVCSIQETDQNYRPIRKIRRYPSKCKPEGKSEGRCISSQGGQRSLTFTACQMYQTLLGILGT